MSKKNSNYHMVVRVTDMDLVAAFIAKAKKLGLTISNNRETKNGIENIQHGNCISVGTSDKFHVNWARNYDYYADRTIVPVYDISLDWSKIAERMTEYASAVGKGESEFETEEGVYVQVDSEEGEVEIGDFTMTKADIKTIHALVNMDIDVAIGEGEITIGDITLTEKEFGRILTMLNK